MVKPYGMVTLSHYVIEGKIIGKRPPKTPLAGVLDRVKDDSPYVAVRRRALDRELWGKTCLWAENTHTHTCSLALPLKFGSPRDNTLSDLRVLLPVSLFIMDERTSEKPAKTIQENGDEIWLMHCFGNSKYLFNSFQWP